MFGPFLKVSKRAVCRVWLTDLSVLSSIHSQGRFLVERIGVKVIGLARDKLGEMVRRPSQRRAKKLKRNLSRELSAHNCQITVIHF